jgi:hypothetical protein
VQITEMTSAAHVVACTLRGIVVATVLAVCGAFPANADDAYIAQATAGPYQPAPVLRPIQLGATPLASHGRRFVAISPTPEASRPSRADVNFAETVEAGHLNNVVAFQAGRNNFSNVGVLEGSGNNVGVFQGGNDLSNLFLVGTKGMSVGVIQPNGAAPLNMLIVRLPNGSILIKR